MNTIINEKEVTFKMLEENIFRMACEWAQKVTTELLEAYDKRLMEERDKKEYRNKGKRNTTVKTIYGEVSYQRNIYECQKGNGQKEYHYLLDEALNMKNVGLFSEHVSRLLIEGITELSYRECSKKISEMTGLSVSAMGVWNVVQTIGEKLCEEESELVQAYKDGKVTGEKESKVLFEEIDGVYVSLQGKDRKKKRTKAEIKVGITYEGWKETGKNRRNLVGKLAVAGFSNAKDFHNYREATIASEYNLDETEIRLLNGDGASWIRKVKDKNTIFQLDPFHRNKAIKETIKEKAYVAEIHRYLKEKNIEGMFEYLEAYRNSLSEEQEMEKVEVLIEYLRKNQKGLLSYKERGVELPMPDEGIKYCEMGTMENHIWGIIARRMKHNHSTWSIRGGNHLAKILAKRESGTLKDVVKKVERNYTEMSLIEEWQENILMAGQIKKKVGKGYEYGLKGHLTLLNHSSGITRAFALNLIG